MDMTNQGNYENRHPDDMVLHPLSEIREWDEALAVLGIQDSCQTPADAIRERDAEIERLRTELQTEQVPAEHIARVIALSYGRDPDEMADWNEMCDADNRPVPAWRVYEEQAESLLATYSIMRPSSRAGES